jgi:hypothetical protein
MTVVRWPQDSARFGAGARHQGGRRGGAPDSWDIRPRAASVLGHIMIDRHLDRVLSSYADYTISVNTHGAGSQLIGTASGAI